MTSPLAGLRVLDVSLYVAGPFATQLLRDLGAEVLRVERPGGGDPMRVLDPAAFAALNRGKRSVALDLRDGDDQEVFRTLAAGADVVVDGLRAGSLDRLGLGYQTLVADNPSLVYLALSGWGSQGPLANAKGFNGTFSARAGATGLAGPRGGPPVDPTEVPVADLAGALYAVVGVLSALIGEQRPVRLEVPLFGAALAMTAYRLVEFEAAGAASRDDVLVRPGNGVFATADGSVSVTAIDDHDFAALCAALDLDLAITHPTLADRHADEATVTATLSSALVHRDRDEVVQTLLDAGVACSPVLHPAEVLRDAQTRALGILRRDPVLHATPPVLGLGIDPGTSVPGLDQDADARRDPTRAWRPRTA